MIDQLSSTRGNAHSLLTVANAMSDWLNQNETTPRAMQEMLLDLLEFLPTMRSCKSCNTGVLLLPHRRESSATDMNELLLTYHCNDCDEFFHGKARTAGAGDGLSPELNLVARSNRIWHEAVEGEVDEVN